MSSRLSKIPKDQGLLSSIKLATLEFKTEHNTTDLYLANKLHFKGNNANSQYTNLLQPFNEKYIKVDELFLLLDNLGTHKKIIIDYICNKYDYTCSIKANNTNCSNDNIKDLLLSIGGSNGHLFNSFLDYSKDKILDKKETNNLIKTSYQTRALLNQFENDLKEKLKGL